MSKNTAKADGALWEIKCARDEGVPILLGEKVQAYLSRLDENFGHCKMLAYFKAESGEPFDRIFGRTDPLYSNE